MIGNQSYDEVNTDGSVSTSSGVLDDYDEIIVTAPLNSIDIPIDVGTFDFS